MTAEPSPPEQGPPARRPLVLGVLGGVAAGKSLAAKLLAGPDGVVIDADRLAHEVLASDEVTALVAERLGPGALGPDGRPDRRALAKLVFADREALRELEGFTHPRVRAMILARLEEARAAGVPRIVLDVPLLLENDERHGLVGLCDALIFVDVGESERERRARSRGWQPDELARRQKAQLPLHLKKARADYVLPNSGGIEELEQAARDLLERLGAPLD